MQLISVFGVLAVGPLVVEGGLDSAKEALGASHSRRAGGEVGPGWSVLRQPERKLLPEQQQQIQQQPQREPR